MTERKIVIKTCSQCTHRSHSGHFTPGGAFPLCRATKAPRKQFPDYKGNCKVLPYIPKENSATRVSYRQATDEIPDWCPLPLNN